MNTTQTTYKNTARRLVFDFIQNLEPSETEAPFVNSVFEKSHVSMKDVKLLLEFVARRAAVAPLQAEHVKALGLPSLTA